MKILIVEDEPSLREIMVQTLRREQYVVEQAADYASALDKIAGYDYDCILLDIMLPDGSGLQLLEELKRQRRQAGIIIISARDSLDDKIEGLELGADDYLPKPFHLAELSAGSGASCAATSAAVRRVSMPETCGCFLTAAGWKSRAGRSNCCARSTIYSIIS